MNRGFFWMSILDPELVFENLQRTRVTVNLEGRDRSSAIAAMEDVLLKAPEGEKRLVLWQIAHAVQRELFKSKEIDVATMEKVASYYPLCVEVEDDRHLRFPYDDDFDFVYKPPSGESESESSDESESADEVHEGEGEGEAKAESMDEDEDEFEAMNEDDFNRALNPAYQEWKSKDMAFYHFLYRREHADPNEFKEAALEELKKQCDIMGCRLKPGQEEEIVSVMISFFIKKDFKIYDDSRMRMFVQRFMSKVKGYISSTCILNDPTTVLSAVKSVEKLIEADTYDVRQQLEKNIIPTNNEEGIECENATPFSQPEQGRNLPHTATIHGEM